MAVNSLSAALLAAADGIRNKELERRGASASLRKIAGKLAEEVSSTCAEGGATLFSPVGKSDFTGKILGVDGGMLKEQYHGIDLILLRAVGVCFEYEKGKLASHAYFPSENPPPEPTTIVDPLSDVEFLLAANILRPKREFETALEAIKKFRPRILVMHGSIVPHPANRADPKGPLGESYRQMLAAYGGLFKFCLENDILLCGVVEDSRDDSFYKSLKGVPPTNCRDTAILFDALETGQRTFAMRHAGASQMPSSLEPFAKNIFSFYLKPAEMDRPLKVDFLAGKGGINGTISEIALAIYNTSRFNRSYGLPTVTIEADARAKFREDDLELIFQQISDRVGPSPLSLALRRRNRPF
jgi:hypothetical protein